MYWRILAAFTLAPSLAFADPPPLQVVTYPPGDDKIVVVKKNEPAPFEGQLFDNDTALRWATWLKQYRERYALDLAAEKDKCEVKLEHERKVGAVEKEAARLIAEDLRKRLAEADARRLKAEEELRNPGFFSRPSTWFVGGVLTTVVVASATAAVVVAAN